MLQVLYAMTELNGTTSLMSLTHLLPMLHSYRSHSIDLHYVKYARIQFSLTRIFPYKD